jgi:glycosyltransferase involved in cell wall biosynthesis
MRIATSSEWPFISVVVPTRDRADVLPYLFQALSLQLYPHHRMELIVVDDGSRDETAALVLRWSRILPFAARLRVSGGRGAAAARNVGTAAAEGDVLAFTDSDCVPGPLWVRSGAAACSRGFELVCGPLQPVPRPSGPGLRAAQVSPVDSDRGTYPTANLFIARAAYARVGGFDETFGIHRWGQLQAGEDTDLAWRLLRQGACVCFSPNATVYHLATSINAWQLLMRPGALSVFPRLLVKIPELRRRYLFWRLFMSGRHLLFLIGIAGFSIAVLDRWWPAVLAILPWAFAAYRSAIAPLIRDRRPLQAVAWAGFLAYLELATLVVLLAASLRHRRVVL